MRGKAITAVALAAGLSGAASWARADTITGITASGNTLSSVTVERGGASHTYSASSLIGVDVAAFNGQRTVTLVRDGSGAPATGSRAGLLEDLRLDTGVINPDVGAAAVALSFLSPVVNSVGPDILFFEYGAGTSVDAVRVQINGQTKTYAASAYAQNLLPGSVAADTYGVSTASGEINSLAALESTTFSKISDVSQNIAGLAIDLSDFGVAEGASVNSMSFGADSTTAAVDAVLVAGLQPVPLPGTASAVLVLLGGLACSRRRRGRLA